MFKKQFHILFSFEADPELRAVDPVQLKFTQGAAFLKSGNCLEPQGPGISEINVFRQAYAIIADYQFIFIIAG